MKANKATKTIMTALLVLLMAGSAMCATPELMEAPRKDAATLNTMNSNGPLVIDGHGTGFVAPGIMIEISNLNNVQGNGHPSTYDWRDYSAVTSVKDQGSCGSCYAFAAVTNFESEKIIQGEGTRDYSEESAKECNWEAVNGYSGWGSCNGGTYRIVANTWALSGTVYEADDPYNAYATSCNPSAPRNEKLTDWIILAYGSSPSIDTIKGHILNYGPVYSTVDANCLSGYNSGIIDGSSYYVANHAIQIVGWDDSPGYWICKNSWGPGWGESGYFNILYNGGAIGKYMSAADEWIGADDYESLYYHDDAGANNCYGWSGGHDDAYTMMKAVPDQDEAAVAGEVWLFNGADVDMYLYDDFDGTTPSNLLASSTGNNFPKPGYYSVEFDTPANLIQGDAVYLVAYIDENIGVQGYPMATDVRSACAPGETWASIDGTNWRDWCGLVGGTIGLRLRTEVDAEPPTPPETFFEVFLDDKDGEWQPIDNDIGVLVNGSSYGDEFTYNVTGKLFEPGCYYLIYYADKPDRFDEEQWRGANPGALIASLCAEAPDGAVSKTGSIDLGINMPEPPDWNIQPDPWNEYCSDPDNYDHCCGAKLWVVPCDDYNISSNEVTNWNPTEFLFETDLIWYDDTDHNHAPEVLDVVPDGACYAAGDTVGIAACIRDDDGCFDLENMVVEADLSAFGVDDPVVLNFVGATDCVTATYSGSAIVTMATVDECNGQCADSQSYIECTEFYVTATDPSGDSDRDESCMDVEPGPCAHLDIEALGRTDLLMWNHICLNIELDPDTPWFDYGLYFTAFLVTSEDEYGNMNPEICCDPKVYGTGNMSILHDEFIIPEIFSDLPGTLVVVYNDEAVETCTLTAVCEGVTEVTPAEIDIGFLEPIKGADVVAWDDYLFHNGDCACDVDCTTVTAQLTDENGESIWIEGVPVQFSAYFDNQQGMPPAIIDPEIAYTDEYGMAYTGVYITGETPGTLDIIAVAECRGGDTMIDILEPPCYIQMFADPDELIEPDDCGVHECSYITGQLFDQFNEPVEVGDLAIELYFNEDYWQTVYTNEGGGIETTICTDHPDMDIGTNEIGAEGVECDYYGNVCIEVVVPELTTILLTPDETPQTMVLCSERDFTATCYNQNDGIMCCPGDLGWIHGENTAWDDGTLVAVNIGSDTVWVETTFGDTVESNHIVIDVIQGDVAEIMIEPELIKLELCSSAPITVTCYDCNGDEMDCGEYDVSIELPEVASYSEGYVTGDALGDATLTVSVGEVSDTADVTVTDTIAPEVSVIAIEPDDCCIGAIISIYAFVDDCGNSPNALTVMANGETMTHDDEGVFWCDYVAQEGTNVVNVTATDPSGNANYDDTDNYTASNTPPEITMVSVTESTCPGSLIEIVVEVEDDCTDPEDLVVMAIIGENVIELEYGDSLFMGQVDAEEGIHYVNVTAEDEHDGLVYDDTQCYDATNLAPLVSGVMLSPTSCYTGDTITVNVTVSDDCTDVEDLIVKADGKNLTYTAGYFVGTFCAVEGTHNVTVSVWDELGEIGENDSAQYTATKKKSKKSPGGSSGGGIYPPGWGQSTNVTEPESDSDSGNGTYPDEPESSGQEEEPDGGVVVTEPDGAEPPESGGVLDGPQGNATETPPCTGPFCPGFVGITGIIAILAMVLIARRRR